MSRVGGSHHKREFVFQRFDEAARVARGNNDHAPLDSRRVEHLLQCRRINILEPKWPEFHCKLMIFRAMRSEVKKQYVLFAIDERPDACERPVESGAAFPRV